MRKILHVILGIGFLLGCFAYTGAEIASKATTLERITWKLVAPPFLPAHEHAAEGPPKVVQVRLVIEEKLMKISREGATIWAMTFHGSVPGPLIVVHQVELAPVAGLTIPPAAPYGRSPGERCPGTPSLMQVL